MTRQEPLGMEQLPRNRMMHLISSYLVSQAVRCAAELRIPEELANGPKNSRELADATGSSVEHLLKLLNILCGVNVLRAVDGAYELTAVGEFLKRDHEGSLWALAVFFGRELYTAVGRMPFAVRTGCPAWDDAFGCPLWDYLERNPDRGRLYDEAMAALCRYEVDAIVAAYDFASSRVVVDVGGGSGSLLRAILSRNPALTGVLFDKPRVIDGMAEDGQADGLADRCRCERGDFFRAVPGGADLYVLRHVLHDWDDDHARQILRTCDAYMPRGARLLIIEQVVGEDEPSRVRWMDFGMTMVFGGKERTLSEYEMLCADTDLNIVRAMPTAGTVSILEAIKTPASAVDTG